MSDIRRISDDEGTAWGAAVDADVGGNVILEIVLDETDGDVVKFVV